MGTTRMLEVACVGRQIAKKSLPPVRKRIVNLLDDDKRRTTFKKNGRTRNPQDFNKTMGGQLDFQGLITGENISFH